MDFREAWGFDDEFAMEFSSYLEQPGGNDVITMVKDLIIYLNEDIINSITTLPRGVKWNKDEMI